MTAYIEERLIWGIGITFTSVDVGPMGFNSVCRYKCFGGTYCLNLHPWRLRQYIHIRKLWKEAVVALLWYYHKFFLEKPRGNLKILSNETRSQRWDSNSDHSKYEALVVPSIISLLWARVGWKRNISRYNTGFHLEVQKLRDTKSG
jgi:hypothetical protein